MAESQYRLDEAKLRKKSIWNFSYSTVTIHFYVRLFIFDFMYVKYLYRYNIDKFTLGILKILLIVLMFYLLISSI